MPIPAQPGWFLIRSSIHEKPDGTNISLHSEDRVVAWSDDGEEVLVVGDTGVEWVRARNSVTTDDGCWLSYGTEGQPVDVMPAPPGMKGFLKEDDAEYAVAFLGWGDDTLYAYAVNYGSESGGGGTNHISTGYGYFPVEVRIEAVPKPASKAVL